MVVLWLLPRLVSLITTQKNARTHSERAFPFSSKLTQTHLIKTNCYYFNKQVNILSGKYAFTSYPEAPGHSAALAVCTRQRGAARIPSGAIETGHEHLVG